MTNASAFGPTPEARPRIRRRTGGLRNFRERCAPLCEEVRSYRETPEGICPPAIAPKTSAHRSPVRPVHDKMCPQPPDRAAPIPLTTPHRNARRQQIVDRKRSSPMRVPRADAHHPCSAGGVELTTPAPRSQISSSSSSDQPSCRPVNASVVEWSAADLRPITASKVAMSRRSDPNVTVFLGTILLLPERRRPHTRTVGRDAVIRPDSRRARANLKPGRPLPQERVQDVGLSPKSGEYSRTSAA